MSAFTGMMDYYAGFSCTITCLFASIIETFGFLLGKIFGFPEWTKYKLTRWSYKWSFMNW